MAYAGFCQRGSLQSLFRGAGITPEIFFKSTASKSPSKKCRAASFEKNSTRRLISRIILASVVNASSRRCRGLLYLFHISVLYCDSIRCNCSTLNIIGQLQTNNVKYMYDIMTARGSGPIIHDSRAIKQFLSQLQSRALPIYLRFVNRTQVMYRCIVRYEFFSCRC